MIYGFDISAWETITDANAFINDGPKKLEFGYMRAGIGNFDDEKYRQFFEQLKHIQAVGGVTLLGAYQFMTYTYGGGGAAQVQNMWSLISAGGVEFQLPPALDLEYEAFVSNGVRLTRPIPDPIKYLDNTVMPAIAWLKQKMGRLPVIYTGAYFAKDVLFHGLGKPQYDDLFNCPLWVAAWNNVPEPITNGVFPLKGASFDLTQAWPKYAFWQFYGDYPKGGYPKWPGINALDLNIWPGTRAELRAFCMSGAPIPDPDIPAPVYEEYIKIPPVYRYIRSKPDLSKASEITTLRQGQTYKILERVTVGPQVWARVAVNGFVCMQIGDRQYVEVVKVEKE